MAARPIGSAFFGAYADKIGRRFLLMFTIGGVGVMSLLCGFLPTYAQVGVRSYVLYCVLRFFMGIFFGGEYAVGHTFAIEYAPQQTARRHRRIYSVRLPPGLRAGVAGLCPISYFCGKEAILAYGWRIAFMTGVLPGFPGALHPEQSARVARIRKDQSARARSRRLLS